MKITISVGSRFHAFDLARELDRRGHLRRLMTTYPAFAAASSGVDRAKVTSHGWIEGARRLWNRTPAPLRGRANGQYFFNHRFDRWAASELRPDADVLVGWSGYSLETIRRAKELGLLTAVDRGSSHIRFQQRLLADEYARYGLEFDETHPKILQQEVEEYEAADVIHTPSRFAYRSFLACGVPEAKLLYLPYGFHPEVFRPTHAKDEGFRIVYCGALSLRKGFPYLLEAFSAAELPGAELWVFGEPTDDLIRSKTPLHRPGVKYFGRQPWRVLSEFFSRGTVFCLPSIEDGFALVALQAMACGLPVIGTPNSGAPDAVRDGREGFIVPIRDSAALAQRLTTLYEDRDKAYRMGRAARERALSEFSWDHYAERVIGFYQRKL